MGAGAGMNATAPGGFGAQGMGSMTGGFGGSSGSHLSAQSRANTNGPNAADRDTGLDRAEDRMRDQGADHSKPRTGTARKDADDETKASTAGTVDK